MRVFLAQQSAGKAIATISRFAGRQTVQIQMRTFIAPTVSRRGTFLFRSPFFFSTTDDIARDLSVASAAKRSSAYYLGIVSVPVVQCLGPGGQEVCHFPIPGLDLLFLSRQTPFPPLVDLAVAVSGALETVSFEINYTP